MSRWLQRIADHANTLVFALGFATAYVGLVSWSFVVANVAAGVVLMVVGAWPFVRRDGRP